MINTHSKSGRQAHNVYVFQPYKTVISSDFIKSEVANIEKIEVPKESTDLSESINLKNIRTDKQVRNNPLPSWINSDFAKKAAFYFQNEDIEELWRIATIHSRIYKLPLESLIQASNNALECLVYKIKRGSVKVNIRGYFNGIIRNIYRKIYVEELFNSVFDTA